MAALLLIAPSLASAAVYYPSGAVTPAQTTQAGIQAISANDLNDLDHAYYYTWALSGLSTIAANTSITNASIQFRSLYNWTTAANVLHLDLLDSASVGNGTVVTNGGANSQVFRNLDGTVGDQTISVDRLMNDAYRSYTTTEKTTNTTGTEAIADGVITSATGVTLLDERAFVGYNTDYTNVSGITSSFPSSLQSLLGTPTASSPQTTLYSTAGWTVTDNDTGSGFRYTYTYNFDANELGMLKQYINAGNNIAIGFDPDCHFYNDGISFTYDTAVNGTGAAVPEPASLILLGTGLLAAVRHRGRAKRGENK